LKPRALPLVRQHLQLPMALKSTIFKADVQLADIDHGRHSGGGVSSYLCLTS